MSAVKAMCTDTAGKGVVIQGNMAFAVGCVRAGIHAADGYPGTPSTEVIDKGLSQVQDMITVGWSVNEAVAAGVARVHMVGYRTRSGLLREPAALAPEPGRIDADPHVRRQLGRVLLDQLTAVRLEVDVLECGDRALV